MRIGSSIWSSSPVPGPPRIPDRIPRQSPPLSPRPRRHAGRRSRESPGLQTPLRQGTRRQDRSWRGGRRARAAARRASEGGLAGRILGAGDLGYGFRHERLLRRLAWTWVRGLMEHLPKSTSSADSLAGLGTFVVNHYLHWAYDACWVGSGEWNSNPIVVSRQLAACIQVEFAKHVGTRDQIGRWSPSLTPLRHQRPAVVGDAWRGAYERNRLRLEFQRIGKRNQLYGLDRISKIQ